jgi:multiple sugar transport system ATP-binding protein
MADLKITNLHKSFGAVHAVRGIDLEIGEGEFAVLVGPSGCGKSTLLRVVAGLEELDQGTVEIGGRVVNGVAPKDRDIAMVFQNYALYPYKTVFENIAFPLRMRKTAEAEVRNRVRAVAEMLGIASLLDRLPRQLSGGQRQRVAMGRAIVRQPRLFLFDEPLSNLDAQLRDDMRTEIKRLHQELRVTVVYVTHDQIEAMTLADRIVLLKDGVIEQEGRPLEIYERPRTRFAARFLGSPPMGFVEARLEASGSGLALALKEGAALPLSGALAERYRAHAGKAVLLGLRPEHLTPWRGDGRAGVVRLPVAVELVEPTGARTYASVRVGGGTLLAELGGHESHAPGQAIELAVDLNRAVLIDPATEKAL